MKRARTKILMKLAGLPSLKWDSFSSVSRLVNISNYESLLTNQETEKKLSLRVEAGRILLLCFESLFAPRIPTVKLKIPGKAFLKSETRTSVTFKL